MHAPVPPLPLLWHGRQRGGRAGRARGDDPLQRRQGEPFSILNHFISELGQWGVSQGAWAFNAALIVGGLLFIPFVIGLGLSLAGAWSKLGMAAGLLAGVAVAVQSRGTLQRLPAAACIASAAR